MGAVQKDKIFTKDYVIITIFHTVQMICVQMYFPIMSLFARTLTDSNFFIGITPGIFTLASLVSIKMGVPLIKKYGKAKTMAYGSIIMTIAAVVYLFAGNVLMLIIGRTVQGIGNGFCNLSTTNAVADVLPKSRLMEGIGYYSLVQIFVQAVAPALALTLVENGQSGYDLVFIMAIVIGVICFLLALPVKYETKGTNYAYNLKQEEAKKREEEEKKRAEDILAGKIVVEEKNENVPKLKLLFGIERILFMPMFMLFAGAFVMQSLGSYLTLSTQERGISSIAMFFTIQAAAIFVSRLIASKTADKYGAGVILVPAFILLGISIFVIAHASVAMTFFIISIPYGFASGAIQPTLNGLFFKIGHPSRGPETSGAFTAMGNLSAVVLALAVAFISSFAGGYAHIYDWMFILPILGLGAYFVHASQLRKRNKEMGLTK